MWSFPPPSRPPSPCADRGEDRQGALCLPHGSPERASRRQPSRPHPPPPASDISGLPDPGVAHAHRMKTQGVVGRVEEAACDADRVHMCRGSPRSPPGGHGQWDAPAPRPRYGAGARSRARGRIKSIRPPARSTGSASSGVCSLLEGTAAVGSEPDEEPGSEHHDILAAPES